MDITKRNGTKEAYNASKITRAISKAFEGVRETIDPATLDGLLVTVEDKMAHTGASDVEAIQNLVEETLMEKGFYTVARAYILYRNRRSELREARSELVAAVGIASLDTTL